MTASLMQLIISRVCRKTPRGLSKFAGNNNIYGCDISLVCLMTLSQSGSRHHTASHGTLTVNREVAVTPKKVITTYCCNVTPESAEDSKKL